MILTTVSTKNGTHITGFQGYYTKEQAIEAARKEAILFKNSVALGQLSAVGVTVDTCHSR